MLFASSGPKFESDGCLVVTITLFDKALPTLAQGEALIRTQTQIDLDNEGCLNAGEASATVVAQAT